MMESELRAREVTLGDKPIPVLKELRLLDDACGTQVLTPLVSSQEGELLVPPVPQEQQ